MKNSDTCPKNSDKLYEIFRQNCMKNSDKVYEKIGHYIIHNKIIIIIYIYILFLKIFFA
jgi:hypothetical protein